MLQDVLRERETSEAARIQLDQVRFFSRIIFFSNNVNSALQKLSA
jgi:hypothetical protein